MRIKILLTAIVALASLAVSAPSNLREHAADYLGIPTEASDHSGDEHAVEGTYHSSAHESEGGQHDGQHTGEHHAKHKIVATSPAAMDVTLTQQYVCQIHSRRHIEVCAIEGGYLKEIKVNEGQAVKKGETIFHILPTIYSAKLDADMAEARLAEVEYDNTKNLVDQNIVSNQELKLAKARLAKALAKVKLARAEMNFADIKAPFDGILDRFEEQEGSLIEEGAMLTTLSDNRLMWIYFNVPEARYLDYQAAINAGQDQDSLQVELKLANHEIFNQPGKIGAIEADFNNETGNIAFRADFPNPNGLLRHGQTGTVLIHQVEKDAVVIPQRATFEILAKRYAYVIDEDNIVHQREIQIQNEKDDIYIIAEGLKPTEKIVLEGVLQVRDGETVDYEFQPCEEVLANLKYHAE